MKTEMNIQRTHFDQQKDYSKNYDFSKDYRVQIMLKKLQNVIQTSKQLRILDVGVGDGFMYKKLAQTNEIYGIDISKNLVDIAISNKIKAQVCDVERDGIPFEGDFFDVVVTGETIEHVVNSDFFLSEINRVLKPNGLLILSYPNINTVLGVFMMMILDQPPMYAARYRSPHVRDWTKKTIIKALRNSSFGIEKIIGASFFLPIIGMFTAFGLSRYLSRFCNSAVVFARKEQNAVYDELNSIKINNYV